MLRITVGGDPAGGYLVDIHDGERHGVYSPTGVDTDIDALRAALQQHDPELLAKITASAAPKND